jgi:RimJ/RimL family protein N-acetyltransferase
MGFGGPCDHAGMDSPAAPPISVPILDTDRLRLRPFRQDDAAWVYYVSLDPDLRHWISLPDPYLRSHARHFVDHFALATARTGQGADFAIEDPSTRIGIGWVGIHRKERNEVSCGYWLAADARGLGYMTEALRAACRWALHPAPDGLGAARVRWHAKVGNHASRRVAQHVGFTIHSGTELLGSGEKWAGHAVAGGI